METRIQSAAGWRHESQNSDISVTRVPGASRWIRGRRARSVLPQRPRLHRARQPRPKRSIGTPEDTYNTEYTPCYIIVCRCAPPKVICRTTHRLPRARYQYNSLHFRTDGYVWQTHTLTKLKREKFIRFRDTRVSVHLEILDRDSPLALVVFAVPPPMNRKSSLPQRTDSLGVLKSMAFSQIEEELRDIKRVNSQGQEEDLRMALSRTISRVEELVCLCIVLLHLHYQ